MQQQAELTIKEWVESMANTKISHEEDSTKMQYLLRRVGHPNAVVTSGVVYLMGVGTEEAPPIDIHSMAKLLLQVAEKK